VVSAPEFIAQARRSRGGRTARRSDPTTDYTGKLIQSDGSILIGIKKPEEQRDRSVWHLRKRCEGSEFLKGKNFVLTSDTEEQGLDSFLGFGLKCGNRVSALAIIDHTIIVGIPLAGKGLGGTFAGFHKSLTLKFGDRAVSISIEPLGNGPGCGGGHWRRGMGKSDTCHNCN
jgi:hypothetical protein